MKFFVRDMDTSAEDGWETVAAYDAEEAAEKLAKRIHEDDPANTDGPLSVAVQSESGEVTEWEVQIDHEPVFYASQVRGPGTEPPAGGGL